MMEERKPLKAKDKPVKEFQMVCLELQPGKWKNAFNTQQYKLMVAEALNYCVLMQSFRIKGYLIAESGVYLCIQMSPDHAHRLLMLFFERMRRELHAYLVLQHGAGNALSQEEMEWIQDESYRSLFTSSHLVDDDYIGILTGKKVKHPYHKISLAYFTEATTDNDFCSVKDYSGGRSAVLIDTFGAR